MVSLARTLSRAVASYVALAAAALAQGAVAIESGRDGLRLPEASSETLAQPGAAVPSYLDAARLPQVEEAYRARAARANGGERREHEAGAREPEDERDRAVSQDVEPQREPERVPRLAATGPEGGEESEAGGREERGAKPRSVPHTRRMPPAGRCTQATPRLLPTARAAGRCRHGGNRGAPPAAERRAAEAEAGRAAEAAARRRAEHTAQTAAKKAADLSRAPRQGDREQADRRGEDAQKPREGRRGARPQAERTGARRPGRDSDKRANVADPGRHQRGAGRAEPPPGRAPPPPPPPEIELPPPRRPFSLLDIFSSGPPGPPAAESSRPVIPDEIRSTGSYMR